MNAAEKRRRYVAKRAAVGATCVIGGCGRVSIARDLCNAHYIRRRKSMAMDVPIRVIDPQRGCSVPGCEGEHYGFDACKKHYKVARRRRIRARAVAEAGWRCVDCGGSFPLEVFDFHHKRGDKNFTISAEMETQPEESLMAEARRCILLCANCHRIRHATVGVHFDE